jgi:hypothetical protein
VGNATQVLNTFKTNYDWPVRTASPPTGMAPVDLSQAEIFQYTAAALVTDRTINLMAAPAPAAVQQPLKAAASAVPSTAVAAKVAIGKEGPASKKKSPADPAERKKIAKERAVKNLGDGQKAITAAPDVQDSSVARDWFVDDVVERLSLEGSFSIYFFIGEVPPPNVATSDYMSYPTLAGVNHIFAAPTEACDNCGIQQHQAHLVTDTAVITSMLLDYVQIGQLEDLTVRNVKPFLIKRLKWRVVTVSAVPFLLYNI